MKKSLIVTLSIASLTLIGCGQVPSQNAAMPVMRMSAQSQVRSLNLAKPNSQTLKAGSPELGINQAKGQLKPVVPFEVRLEAVRRDLGSTEVMAIARIGLDSMERAKTYEDGYNIGRSTLESLSRHNAYIARLALAATNPEMKYESAYKAASKALAFIANNREITIYNACDLVRDMMTAAKTWEDGSRIGYATMGFIRQSASSSITAVIDSSVRSAQSARYWEDAYNILFNAYGSIRHMK